MKLYQLEYLTAVCKYGSISRAADAMLVSRPAVSRAIKELEAEFGVSFFLRTTTGVLMTDAGKLVYEKCQSFDRLFAELQTELSALKNSGDSSSRSLHIGISFTARCRSLPFISAFRNSHPNVNVKLTDLQDSFIDSGRLDQAFDLEIALTEARDYEGVGFIDIEDSSLCFCCSRRHPLAGRSRVSMAEICHEPMGGINYLEQKDNQMLSLFAKCGMKPNIAQLTQQVAFLCQMIRDGLCCSIKPRQSIEGDPEIAVIPIDEAPPLRLRILWDESSSHGSAFRDFLDYARLSLAEPAGRS